MIPGFDPVSASRRLEALVAAIQAFPPERQATVLREYLDAELGRLEAVEDAHHAFLGECVLLAIDNMQDARLHLVEERLAALESPDGPSLADVLTEAALVFALSIASVAAVEVLGGAVLLWAGQAALAPAARKTVEEADQFLLTTARTQVKGLSELYARQATQTKQLQGLTTVLDALRGGSLSSALWQVGKALLSPIATARSISDAMTKTFRVAAESEAIQAQILLGQLALAEGMEASVTARTRYESALTGDAARLDTKWRNLLDNAGGGIVLAPAYTIFQNLWKKVPASGQPTASKVADPFLASTPAGRLLTHMRDNRLAVREEYAVLRAGLRYRTDDAFVEDPLVAELSGLVTELAPLRTAYRALEDTVRPLIVRGYEAALWWAYLQTNGMLGLDEDAAYQVHSEHLTVGHVVDGHVITKVPPRLVPPPPSPMMLAPETRQPTYVYDTDHYPGVPRLSEGQAEYLYETFAAPYFAVSEHAATLPSGWDYDPANYIGVTAMPERLYAGFVFNDERAKRMNEMRLMAILFFQRLPGLEDPTSSGMLDALGELRGAPPSAARWLTLHPGATTPAPSNPLADGSSARAAQAAAPELSALLADSGVLTRTLYETQRSELRAAIAELRNDIADMQALANGDLTVDASSRGLDLEAYDALVKSEREELLDLYARVLTTAQFDEAEVTRLQAQYDALVERLSTWTLPPTTTKPKASPFRFQTPAPTR